MLPSRTAAVAGEAGKRAGQQGDQGVEDDVAGRRAAGDLVVDLDDLGTGVDPVEEQRQRRVVGDLVGGVADIGAGDVGLLEAFAQRRVRLHDGVAHRRQPAHDRALPERDQHVAVAPEVLQDVHVLLVAAAALDDADVAAPGEGLDVGQRRAVELHRLHQPDQALVDVEDRHMAAEAPGQRDRSDARPAGLGHLRPSFLARSSISWPIRPWSKCRSPIGVENPSPLRMMQPTGQACTA